MLKLMLSTFISRLATAVVNFGVIVLISRTLGPEGKGLSTLLLVTLVSVQMLCDFAGGAALVYLSSRYKIFSLIVPTWTWAAICSFGLGVYLTFSDQHQLHEIGWQAGLLCFINTTYTLHIHLLNGREWFKLASGLLLLQACITFVSLFFMLRSEPAVLDYFYALYVSWGTLWLVSIACIYFIRKDTLLLDDAKLAAFNIRKDIRRLFSTGAANQFGHLLQFFNQRIFFWFMPAYGLGIYSNAVALSESIWMIAGSVAMVQYGKIANMSDQKKAAELTAELFRATLWLSFFAVLAAAIIPAGFYELLFGPAFKDVKRSLVVLLPGVLFLSGYLIIGHYFSGTGKFYRNNLAILFGVLVTAIGFLWMHFLGNNKPDEISAAAITSVANFAIFFSVIWFFKADSGIHWKSLIPRWNDVQRFVKWFRPAA